ncbi:MAG TPA: hypothetical protein VH165_21340, partial [Kofleriaceae bacterium]|nr:hypothetical protein [Kofleriaceae bacterium]
MLALADRLQLLELGVTTEEVAIEDWLSDDVLDAHDGFVVRQICRTTSLLYDKSVVLNLNNYSHMGAWRPRDGRRSGRSVPAVELVGLGDVVLGGDAERVVPGR